MPVLSRGLSWAAQDTASKEAMTQARMLVNTLRIALRTVFFLLARGLKRFRQSETVKNELSHIFREPGQLESTPNNVDGFMPDNSESDS